MKKTAVLLALVFAAAATGVLTLSVGPWLLTRHPSAGMTADQRLKARNDVRTTLIQALGAAGLIGGLFFTYRTYRLSSSQQITDRYTKAVEQLGHASEDVRTGAIYALERVIKDSPRDRPMILAALVSFARRRGAADVPGETGVTADLQAAVTVIARTRCDDDARVVLANSAVRNLELLEGNLRGAVFDGADLTGSRLAGADLDGARFEGSSLVDADLSGCRLTGASLRDADLTGADFRGAELSGADLAGADVRGAKFLLGSLSDGQILSMIHKDDVVWSTRATTHLVSDQRR